MVTAEATKTVLWVDQDAGGFRAIWRHLQRKGVGIVPAASVAEGVEALRDTPPDVIILDALVRMTGSRLTAEGSNQGDEVYRNITGHHLFDEVQNAHEWRRRAVVLSVVGKNLLVAAGFPSDFAGFFQKDEVIERDGFERLVKALDCALARASGQEDCAGSIDGGT